MKFFWILLAVAMIGGARAALSQQADDPKQYTSEPEAPLDKNYGLPSFEMPATKVPKPESDDAEQAKPAVPDFFKRPPDLAIPNNRIPTSGDSAETPLFTTPEGSTTGESPVFATSGRSNTRNALIHNPRCNGGSNAFGCN